jgi:hypothetical protein
VIRDARCRVAYGRVQSPPRLKIRAECPRHKVREKRHRGFQSTSLDGRAARRLPAFARTLRRAKPTGDTARITAPTFDIGVHVGALRCRFFMLSIGFGRFPSDYVGKASRRGLRTRTRIRPGSVASRRLRPEDELSCGWPESAGWVILAV